jgi:hypothetical protein
MVRLSDQLRFALLVLLLVAAPIAIGLYVPGGIVHNLTSKWARFTILTVCLLGFLTNAYWKVRTDLRFWSIYLIFATIHIVGVGYFFWSGNGLPFPIFEIICVAEIVGMGLVIYWVLGIGPSPVKLDV